jgi:hypothetical protein
MANSSVVLLQRPHLEALTVAYPDDLTVEPATVLASFDEFQMPIQHGIVVDERYRKIGDDLYSDINQCVFSGLSYVTLSVRHHGEPRRSYSRERAVKSHLEDPSMHRSITRITENAELDDAARHFFIYGVALGVGMRHERSIRDLFRNQPS